MYKKATELCKLILCPATLLKLSIVSRSILMKYFGCFMYSIMASANGDTLTSFLILVP